MPAIMSKTSFRMSGLAKRMPITFWTFTVALLALIGTPFITAGFYSKDAILALAYQQSTPAFFCLVLGAVLTAFYDPPVENRVSWQPQV